MFGVMLGVILCFPQNYSDGLRKLSPFGAVLCEDGAAGFGDAVVAAGTIVFGAFVGLHVTSGFEFVERGVEGAFFEVENAFGAGFDGLGDGVAVGWGLGEGFEDQGGEGAFEVHSIPWIPMHRIEESTGVSRGIFSAQKSRGAATPRP